MTDAMLKGDEPLPAGIAKVADLGLAHVYAREKPAEGVGGNRRKCYVGATTPLYRSPEEYVFNSRNIDAYATDIYAFGLMLYMHIVMPRDEVWRQVQERDLALPVEKQYRYAEAKQWWLAGVPPPLYWQARFEHEEHVGALDELWNLGPQAVSGRLKAVFEQILQGIDAQVVDKGAKRVLKLMLCSPSDRATAAALLKDDFFAP